MVRLTDRKGITPLRGVCRAAVNAAGQGRFAFPRMPAARWKDAMKKRTQGGCGASPVRVLPPRLTRLCSSPLKPHDAASVARAPTWNVSRPS